MLGRLVWPSSFSRSIPNHSRYDGRIRLYPNPNRAETGRDDEAGLLVERVGAFLL